MNLSPRWKASVFGGPMDLPHSESVPKCLHAGALKGPRKKYRSKLWSWNAEFKECLAVSCAGWSHEPSSSDWSRWCIWTSWERNYDSLITRKLNRQRFCEHWRRSVDVQEKWVTNILRQCLERMSGRTPQRVVRWSARKVGRAINLDGEVVLERRHCQLHVRALLARWIREQKVHQAHSWSLFDSRLLHQEKGDPTGTTTERSQGITSTSSRIRLRRSARRGTSWVSTTGSSVMSDSARTCLTSVAPKKYVVRWTNWRTKTTRTTSLQKKFEWKKTIGRFVRTQLVPTRCP